MTNEELQALLTRPFDPKATYVSKYVAVTVSRPGERHIEIPVYVTVPVDPAPPPDPPAE